MNHIAQCYLIFGVCYYVRELVNSTITILFKAKYQLLADQNNLRKCLIFCNIRLQWMASSAYIVLFSNSFVARHLHLVPENDWSMCTKYAENTPNHLTTTSSNWFWLYFVWWKSAKCIGVFKRKAISILNQLCVHRKYVIAKTRHYLVLFIKLIHCLRGADLAISGKTKESCNLAVFFLNT